MKYLDILKKCDSAIVEESKKLDCIYKKLLGESCEDGSCNEEEKCDCGKEDCPICGKKKVEEGCDKAKFEFDEDDAEGGKVDKKMLSKEEFLKMMNSKGSSEDKGSSGEGDDGEGDNSKDDDSKEEFDENDVLKGGQHNGHIPESEENDKGEDEDGEKEEFDENDVLKGGQHNGHIPESKIEDEIREFFLGTPSASDDSDNITEDVEKNTKMSAADIFAESDDKGDDEKKTPPPAEEDGEKKEVSAEPPAEDGEKKEASAEPSAEDGEKKDGDKKEVSEGDGKTIRELMGKKVNEGERLSMKEIMMKEDENNDDGAGEDDNVDQETKSLNESIQAIKKFVKANKKFFNGRPL